jgi:hypothetical protein
VIPGGVNGEAPSARGGGFDAALRVGLSTATALPRSTQVHVSRPGTDNRSNPVEDALTPRRELLLRNKTLRAQLLQLSEPR